MGLQEWRDLQERAKREGVYDAALALAKKEFPNKERIKPKTRHLRKVLGNGGGRRRSRRSRRSTASLDDSEGRLEGLKFEFMFM